MATSKWLKQLRVRLGPWKGKPLPQPEFAKRLGYTDPSTVKRAETTGRLTLGLWHRLHDRADVLEIPVEEIPAPVERLPKGGKTPPGRPQERPGAGTALKGRGALADMVNRRGGSALGRALERALESDETAGNRQSLREFGRLIWRLATDLKALGHIASATEFMELHKAIQDEAERLERLARGEVP